MLEKVPNILANSNSIVLDIEKKYDLKISEKTTIIPHGTFDPFLEEFEKEYDDYNLNNILKKIRLILVLLEDLKKGKDSILLSKHSIIF